MRWIIWTVVATLIFIVAMTIFTAVSVLTSPATAATACQAHAGGGSWWMWRQIDGRRCWYPGRRRLGKSSLYWPDRELDDRPTRRARSAPPPPPTVVASAAAIEPVQVQTIAVPSPPSPFAIRWVEVEPPAALPSPPPAPVRPPPVRPAAPPPDDTRYLWTAASSALTLAGFVTLLLAWRRRLRFEIS